VHGDILQANQDSTVPTTDGLDNVRHAVQLEHFPYYRRPKMQCLNHADAFSGVI
jgi:hypothetical protein